MLTSLPVYVSPSTKLVFPELGSMLLSAFPVFTLKALHFHSQYLCCCLPHSKQFLIVHGEEYGKAKFTLEQTMKAQKGNKDTALFL